MTTQQIHKKASELIVALDDRCGDSQLWLAWMKISQGMVNIKKQLYYEEKTFGNINASATTGEQDS